MNYYFKILKFAQPYRTYILFSLLCSILYVIFNGLSLWIVGSLLSSVMSTESLFSTNGDTFTSIINSYIFGYINNQDTISKLQFLCFILISSFLFKNIFYFLNTVLLSYANNKIITDLRNEIFSHIQKLNLGFFKNKDTSEITSIIITDVNLLRGVLSRTIINIFNQPLTVLFCIITLFLINYQLALITFTVIPISGFITIKLGKSLRRKASRMSVQMASLLNIVIENITNIKVVKAFTRELDQIKNFTLEGQKLFYRVFKLDAMIKIMPPINDMIGSIIGAILLWVGGKQVLIDGTLTPDGFIKFFTFLFAMFTPAKKLVNLNAEINTGIASAKRIYTLLDSKSFDNLDDSKSKKIAINDFNQKIEFQNVFYKYNDNQDYTLKDIDFVINRGDKIALVGESGSGKTTFSDLISRYYSVSKGNIIIDGIDINSLDVISLRKKIGIVSQNNLLFNTSIYDNIKFGNIDVSEEDIFNAAKIANACDFIEKLDDKYQTIVGEKGNKLSEGQKQRIAIARAVVKNPSILILDEATSALDAESEDKIQLAMNTIMKDRTVIIIAHRLSTIKNCDKILVLENGSIIEQGNHAELINNSGKYSQLYKLQFLNKK
ncbi:MAG: hypothetical protein CMG66_04740 [Candidatus Marinimicrobia bacterium]|nr:hypothetical protein [Candidatus Neomarinimicrobiota bacterium]|tara:strand:+ start:6484 stop:8304 length:1821 start_codon:yes stop_codon:yes gene_type:complete